MAPLMTFKISEEVFNIKLQNLMNTTSSIQPRLIELYEFEKQWRELFSSLIPHFGKDVQIHVADQMLLRTYQYDKYHVIYDDLLSLVENEIMDETSASHNAAIFLKVKSPEDFLKFEEGLIYTGDIEKNRLMFEKIFANEKRISYLETYQRLFGSSEDLDESWAVLKSNLASFKPELRGLRNLFSHRHQLPIQQRYSASWQDLDSNKIKSIFERFYKIIKDLYLLNTRTAVLGVKADFKLSVSNQIDLILFGNIENCIHEFQSKFPHSSYWQSRNAYYKSSHLIDKLVVR